MNKRDAIKEMLDGKKVKHPAHKSILCYSAVEGFKYEFEGTTGSSTLDHWWPDDDGYEIVVEKIKVAPALYKTKAGTYNISDRLFSNMQAAENYCYGYFVRWLIDTPYALEVEE